jgi:hypothetical protein
LGLQITAQPLPQFIGRGKGRDRSFLPGGEIVLDNAGSIAGIRKLHAQYFGVVHRLL